MAREYNTPSHVVVKPEAADAVGRFLADLIPTHAPPGEVDEWVEVCNALLALGNGTDAIVTDPEALDNE
jgi:hypothetical protein